VLPVASAISAIAGPNVNSQLQDPLAHRSRVAQITFSELVDSSDYSRLCQLVPETLHPLLKRQTSGLILIVNDIEHH
jgi:hypothetical protein